MPGPPDSAATHALAPLPVAAGLSGEWWFWVIAAATVALLAAGSGRQRALAARARRAAVRRGLVRLPSGQGLGARPPGFTSDLTWLAVAVGAWVILSPWIWGYDDAGGAIATDSISGAAVIVVALGAIVLPALWALGALAGTWLVTAPWVVGYGNAAGPVGLSDTVAGLVVCAIALAGLVAAQRALRPGGGNAIGRFRPPAGPG